MHSQRHLFERILFWNVKSVIMFQLTFAVEVNTLKTSEKFVNLFWFIQQHFYSFFGEKSNW